VPELARRANRTVDIFIRMSDNTYAHAVGNRSWTGVEFEAHVAYSKQDNRTDMTMGHYHKLFAYFMNSIGSTWMDRRELQYSCCRVA